MKSKPEIKLDEEFERLGIKPRIYHFTERVVSFNAITIVTQFDITWDRMWELVKESVLGKRKQYSEKTIGEEEEKPTLHKADQSDTTSIFNRATRLLQNLAAISFYGVAICDKRDQFNRQRGRIIAKGRLLKHLKGENRK